MISDHNYNKNNKCRQQKLTIEYQKQTKASKSNTAPIPPPPHHPSTPGPRGPLSRHQRAPRATPPTAILTALTLSSHLALGTLLGVPAASRGLTWGKEKRS